MSTGGWSNILCQGKQSHQPLDIAVVFVGKEDSFTKSNFSMAYPYVSARITEEAVENSLIEEFGRACDHKLGVGNIIVTESCLVEDKGYSKLADMQSVEEYVASMEKGIKEQTDLLVVCRGGFSSFKDLDRPHSEGQFFSELMSSLDHSGAKYSVLYVSDPYNPIQYPSHQIGRLLAEASGNASLNSTAFCDGVCQIKKTLLEAVFVAITLLIILISGLCCMMGIDTAFKV
ncbi:Exocyst complex component sec15 [Bienertia sinuspersici]